MNAANLNLIGLIISFVGSLFFAVAQGLVDGAFLTWFLRLDTPFLNALDPTRLAMKYEQTATKARHRSFVGWLLLATGFLLQGIATMLPSH